MKSAEKRIGNYHTHTMRCGHAAGSDEDYVLAAIEAGWKVLGFSDHAPWPYRSGYTNLGVRMTTDMLKEYCASVRALQEKYKGRIRIYLGLECEYFPAYMDWLREQKEKLGLDFLIFGNHFEDSDEDGIYYGAAPLKEHALSYCKNALLGMETGLFSYFAHPDLFLMNYPVFDETAKQVSETICRRALELHIPLEYNLQGQRLEERGKAKGVGYPKRDFWEIAGKVGNEVIIGMDAHSPDALIDSERYNRAMEELRRLGVKQIFELPGLGE
ncbi:MAG: histidinol-phosphatase [Oscillospiraceae bacterium]|nr:histidinol-phosphatase [Oscillospiraceae bacterium]